MPQRDYFARKRKRSDDPQPDELQSNKKRQKKVFEIYSVIGYTEDTSHILHLDLPAGSVGRLQNLVSKELVSLLNSSGGIICFGVRANGSVVGIKTTRKDEDVYKCTIDEAVKRIHPMVKPSKYRVSFTPVVDHRGGETKKCVLEIRVEKGDRFQIYETGCDPKIGKESYVLLRKDGKLFGPLTPHQIKERAIELLKEKLKYQSELVGKLLGGAAPSKVATESKERVPFSKMNSQISVDKHIEKLSNKLENPEKTSSSKEHMCNAENATTTATMVSQCEGSAESPIPDTNIKNPPKKMKRFVSTVMNNIRKIKNPFHRRATSKAPSSQNDIPVAGSDPSISSIEPRPAQPASKTETCKSTKYGPQNKAVLSSTKDTVRAKSTNPTGAIATNIWGGPSSNKSFTAIIPSFETKPHPATVEGNSTVTKPLIETRPFPPSSSAIKLLMGTKAFSHQRNQAWHAQPPGPTCAPSQQHYSYTNPQPPCSTHRARKHGAYSSYVYSQPQQKSHNPYPAHPSHNHQSWGHGGYNSVYMYHH